MTPFFRMLSEGIFAELRRQEQSTLDQQHSSQQKMEEELRAEMRQVTDESHMVLEEELKLKAELEDAMEHVHGDVEGLQKMLSDAQGQMTDMRSLLGSQAKVIQAQQSALEISNERADAAEKANAEIKAELSELFIEMRSVQPTVEAEQEKLEANRRDTTRHWGEFEVHSAEMKASLDEVHAEVGEMRRIKQRWDSDLNDIRFQEARSLSDLQLHFSSQLKEHNTELQQMKQVHREYHSESSPVPAPPLNSWMPTTPTESQTGVFHTKKTPGALPSVMGQTKKAMLASTVLRTFRRASGALTLPAAGAALPPPIRATTTPELPKEDGVSSSGSEESDDDGLGSSSNRGSKVGHDSRESA